jgi:hypothetical protein
MTHPLDDWWDAHAAEQHVSLRPEHVDGEDDAERR